MQEHLAKGFHYPFHPIDTNMQRMLASICTCNFSSMGAANPWKIQRQSGILRFIELDLFEFPHKSSSL